MKETVNNWRRVLVTLVLAGTFAIGLATNASAQESSGYSFSVDIPMQFAFTGDVKGTSGPAGYKAALEIPFHIGVGTEAYSVDAKDASGTTDITFEFEFTDIYVWYKFDVMTAAAGVGDGTVVLVPYDDGTNSISTEEADADQTFIILGWLLNERWEFHVAYHQIDAVANVLVNGVLVDMDGDGTNDTVDVGGVMTTAGFKYMF